MDFFIWNGLDLFLALFWRSVLLETAVPSYPVPKRSLQIRTLNKIDYANANHLIPKVVEKYLAGGWSLQIPGKLLRGEGFVLQCHGGLGQAEETVGDLRWPG